MAEVYCKYKSRNVFAGVDGCHIPFLEKPWNLLPGRSSISVINRKGLYSINAKTFAGLTGKILVSHKISVAFVFYRGGSSIGIHL